MEKKRQINSKYFLIALGFAFFVFFWYISRSAPVAGDDWGYAVGGRDANPLFKAWSNYFTWSGRFLSELWGYAMTNHKRLWNYVNAGIFTGIVYLLLKISNPKEKIISFFVAVFLILSVSDGLRMQTYTWMMGTTYVIPLLLFLLYFLLIKQWFMEGKDSKLRFFIMALLNAFIPLYMENAAAMLFGGNVLLLLYVYFKDKPKCKRILILLGISLVGVAIIRLSPGAIYRLSRDHAEFQTMNLFQKISYNWLPLIRFTFIDHVWLMRIMSLLLISLAIYKYMKKEVSLPLCILICAMNAFACIQSFAWLLYDFVPMNLLYIVADYHVPHSLTLNTIGYVLFTLSLFIGAWKLVKNKEKSWLLTWLLFLAGGANVVMLLSPIFDIRSSIYTVFLFILFVLFMLDEFNFNQGSRYLLIGLAVVGVALASYSYYRLYQMVHNVDTRRQAQIEYYRVRPDDKEAYILGYPALSVHSADVLEGDTFHEEVFKEYYYLAKDVNLHFYYLDNYTKEEIFKQ
ncbi:MAG: hypothetical protein J6D29_06790 [Solobacterium sp.]|nr:hypothetical protein [Solobacterium sp.]